MSSELMQGDVILTIRGTSMEKSHMYQEALWIGVWDKDLFCLRPNTEILDGRYLFYSLKTRKVQADLESRGTGTTVLGIKQSELLKDHRYNCSQSIEVQKRISALLGQVG